MVYPLSHVEKGAGPHRHKVLEIPPIPSCICGCLDLCESAQSAIPFRFAHLNIRVLILFRIPVLSQVEGSCFVFRISSSMCSLCPLRPNQSPSKKPNRSLRAFVSWWQSVNYAKQTQFQNGQYKHKYSKHKGLCQRITNNEQRTLFKTKPNKANFKRGAYTAGRSTNATWHEFTDRMKPRFLNFCSRNSLTGFLDSVEY
jgi:hypothetical protein